MKTVQEYFIELEQEKLINTYFNLYPIQYETFNSDFSINEIKNKCYKKIKGYISILKNLESIIPENNKQSILFAYKTINNNNNKSIDLSFVILNDLIQQGTKSTTYNFEYMEPEQIISFLVADTQLVKENIYEIMSRVLNFIIYDFISRIEKDVKSFKQMILEAFEKSIKEIFEKTDEQNKNVEINNNRENELFSKVYNARMEYIKYSQINELYKLRLSLMN